MRFDRDSQNSSYVSATEDAFRKFSLLRGACSFFSRTRRTLQPMRCTRKSHETRPIHAAAAAVGQCTRRKYAALSLALRNAFAHRTSSRTTRLDAHTPSGCLTNCVEQNFRTPQYRDVLLVPIPWTAPNFTNSHSHGELALQGTTRTDQTKICRVATKGVLASSFYASGSEHLLANLSSALVGMISRFSGGSDEQTLRPRRQQEAPAVR
jgi:hypothetical protein